MKCILFFLQACRPTKDGRHSWRVIGTWLAVVMVGLLFSVPGGLAQSGGEGPFANLPGSWSGAGTISLKSGVKERIRCNAEHNIVSRTNVQLQITCASDSYKFSLYSNVFAANGDLSGFWSESTRSVKGQIVGRVSGDRIQARAVGPTFSALFSMTTRGSRQLVSIESPGSEMAGINITLNRSR